ncbi:alpha-N-acetylglucosaminidase C-terminal domain-containing protein [Streptomyces sp. NPDC007861]|uniref:alpha-N-acetylglucosaminidase n=1 Tax=Streptomyces sp. NPDC007861 TaxID=3154893 RepID=UPI00340555D9
MALTADGRAAPARRSVARLAPSLADAVGLRLEEPRPQECGADGGEGFSIAPLDGRVDGRMDGRMDGRVLITRTTTVALVSGFHWYLRHVAGGHLSRTGDTVPAEAPRPDAVIVKSTPYTDRYIYNFTVNGHTSPYWTFAEWERELDLIAAHGINRALATTGLEQVWVDSFSRFGYTEEEVRDWVCAPSLQPWQHMANIGGIGPAPSPGLMERRVELGRRIVARMRELGIEPVLPGLAGTVPDGFAQRALLALLAAAPRLGRTGTYLYDLVDVALQVLANRARVLLPRIKAAHEAADAGEFDRLAHALLDTARLADTVLATRPEFLLETWLRQAERWGTDPRERAALRADAARLVTVWGDRPAADWVEDYANHDWAGLLSTYYVPRWERYFGSLSASLRSGAEPVPTDWFAHGAAWARHRPRTADRPAGDPLRAVASAAATLTSGDRT